jgi:uncharacterized protein YecE (DUF72 family)
MESSIAAARAAHSPSAFGVRAVGLPPARQSCEAAPQLPMLLSGALLDRLPSARYAAQLPFAELALRAPLPRAPTLRRQRADQPAALTLALRAPKSALVSARGPLRFDDELESRFRWVLDAADALAARVVVLPTPADLTPGGRDRELLQALVARLPRPEGRRYVWEPSGAWEREDAEALARSLELVLACDPLHKPAPPGEVVYARLRALGGRRSFSAGLIEDLLARLTEHEADEIYVVFDAPRAAKHAADLLALAAALAAAQEP